jgi:hypothetical protein
MSCGQVWGYPSDTLPGVLTSKHRGDFQMSPKWGIAGFMVGECDADRLPCTNRFLGYLASALGTMTCYLGGGGGLSTGCYVFGEIGNLDFVIPCRFRPHQ